MGMVCLLLGLCQNILFFLLIFGKSSCEEAICDLRPLATTTAALPADNRFVIDIVGATEKYIPSRTYPVLLYAKDNQSTFIAFTISLSGDTKPNDRNPRRPINLDPGRILPSFKSPVMDAISKDVCPNTLFQADLTPKTSVEAVWLAPPKDNKCVTINAFVAIKPDLWYDSHGPLSKRVCEDTRKAEDMRPDENNNCQVCEEARYQLTFEGTWSFNTHPNAFPATKELARFSDIVGASHSQGYNVWKDNTKAGDDLKMLAEQGNTTKMEVEILKQLGFKVRTLIKATAPPMPNMTTVTSFRTSKMMHLISLAVAIQPSPDWFLGVVNLELCDVQTGTWAKNVKLNLYPMDAGTDSGLNFESANEQTFPPHPISVAQIGTSKEEEKPFAKLKVDLIRTYESPNCSEATANGIEEVIRFNGEEEPDSPLLPTISELPLPTDPSIRDCPMSEWEEWLPCEGECVDGTVNGYKTRFRYPIKDGKKLGTFDSKAEEETEIPAECLQYSTSEIQKCNEHCQEENNEGQFETAEARYGWT